MGKVRRKRRAAFGELLSEHLGGVSKAQKGNEKRRESNAESVVEQLRKLEADRQKKRSYRTFLMEELTREPAEKLKASQSELLDMQKPVSKPEKAG
ncbi:hypothetical protein NDN08_004374 [Rhodosorus marinus]|uniref:Uncharacterized protein n=1 Tax=Rhodosorus marinus TaxID=101924 RepID=A0AAV8UL46_9RHOD|nr:hypothetical protein NDN08_004374 [Rhodosorus marinus]